MTAIAILMPGIVLGTVLKPGSFGTQLLEWRPLRWIGRISYSLYLWQQLFFTERFLLFRPLGRLETWPLNLLLTFLWLHSATMASSARSSGSDTD